MTNDDDPAYLALIRAQLSVARANAALRRARCLRCYVIARLRRGVALWRVRRLI